MLECVCSGKCASRASVCKSTTPAIIFAMRTAQIVPLNAQLFRAFHVVHIYSAAKFSLVKSERDSGKSLNFTQILDLIMGFCYL